MKIPLKHVKGGKNKTKRDPDTIRLIHLPVRGYLSVLPDSLMQPMRDKQPRNTRTFHTHTHTHKTQGG